MQVDPRDVLLTTKNTRVAGDWLSTQLFAGLVQGIGALQGVPLWHSRVPVGDVTCELYCMILIHNHSRQFHNHNKYYIIVVVQPLKLNKIVHFL